MDDTTTPANDPNTNAPPPVVGSSGRPIMGIFITVIIFLAAGLLLTRMIIGGGPPAPTPEFMPVTTDLAAMSFEGDRPIVAVVTADWCGPCQHLKRTTLADDRVRALLAEQTQPVMIDGTDSQVAMSTLKQLGIRAFPSTVVVRDGEPVAMLEGYADADAYLAWLEQHL